MSWILFFFTVAGVQGLLIAFVFIFAWRNWKKAFLGFYLLTFSITILFYVAYWMGSIQGMPVVLRWIGVSCGWLMPAMLLLYFSASKPSRLLIFMHSLPFLIFTALFFLSPISLTGLSYSLALAKMVLLTVYGIFIWRKSGRSALDRLLFIGYAGFVVGMLTYYLLVATGNYLVKWDYLICAMFVMVLYGVTYLSQRSFLSQQITGKYSSSSLTREEGEVLFRRIGDYMERTKDFRDPRFDLSKLAKGMKTPKYRISQALNQYSNTSFAAFINAYRVRDAHEKLMQEELRHLKVEAIGSDAGFRNKVSFYRYFKDHYGMAPGEYRDRHQSASLASGE